MAGLEPAGNEIIHGDCLAVMERMADKSIDLIATDPPFNKGRDFHAAPDSLAAGASFQDRWSWDRDVRPEWVGRITDDFPNVMNVINGSRNSYGDDMGAYLCFMGVRLLEMRRVLKPAGSIYLHCDTTASHYLKIILDSIFGPQNFRNEIIWKKTNSPKAQSSVFGRQHDVIFWYSKSDDYCYNQATRQPDERSKKPFRYNDGDGRGPYQTIALSNTTESGGFAKMKIWEWRGKKARWIYSKETMDAWWGAGLIYKTKTGNYRKKDYWSEKEKRGSLVSDIWFDSEIAPIQSNERHGYPTQKPEALLERIIKASSGAGDVVLDPFCGSGTACAAAEKLGRRWIGIDASERAVVLAHARMSGITRQARLP